MVLSTTNNNKLETNMKRNWKQSKEKEDQAMNWNKIEN